jgi:hypothetical protein
VMRSVAEEFSVPFDSKALEWKITCGPGHKHVNLSYTFFLLVLSFAKHI